MAAQCVSRVSATRATTEKHGELGGERVDEPVLERRCICVLVLGLPLLVFEVDLTLVD